MLRRDGQTAAVRLSTWAKDPKAGASLRANAGRVSSVLVLERDAGKRRDQIAKMMEGAPDDARDAAVEGVGLAGLGDIVSAIRISNKRVDSYDTTFQPDGAQLDDYKRNPVVLFAHDANALPVGRDIGVHVRGRGDGGEVIGVTRFASPDLNPFGDQVGRCVAAGLLNAASIGFEPDEWTIASDRDDGESFMPPIDFTRWRLREYSIVPVPANADALVEGRARMADFGVTDAGFVGVLERMIETLGGLFVPRDELESLRTSIKGTRVQISLDSGASFALTRAEPEDEEPTDEEEKPADDEAPAVVEGDRAEDPDEGHDVDKVEGEATNRADGACPMCGYEGSKDEPAADEGKDNADAAVDGESQPRHAGGAETFSDEVMAAAEAAADVIEQVEIEETGRLP